MWVAGIHQGHAESGATPNSLNLKPKLLVLAITQALALQAAQAASIEVTSNLDDGTDCTLREAIDTVNAGVDQNNDCIITGTLGTDDAISFGAGVAGSTIVTNGELTIAQSVSINSGGTPTTIDANGVGRIINVSANSTLDQLTLTGGNANSYGDGGGIYALADVTLTNSTVSGNSAGGIYANYGASVTLTNSTVSGNSGSGINTFRSSIVRLTNSTVSDNSGGGIAARTYSSVRLTNSTVSGNSSGGKGGGIYLIQSSVTLTNSTISSNTASNGGGISAERSSVTLTNSTVSDNTAGSKGGGIYAIVSTVTQTNSTVSGNTAGSDGGGIYAGGSNVTLTNSTVSDNTAGNDGGGIFSFYYSVTLTNSIVANSVGADCTTSNTTVTAMADSIIEDGSCGPAALAVDPVLGPLADNGGSTQTHALLAGSPAIDNGTGPGATASDQRGVDAEGVRDSGAYEFTGAINTITIEKLINNRVRDTPNTAAQLLAGTRYRADYIVTNNSPNRVYSVQVFEGGQLVCNLYALDPGESIQRYKCASNQDVLVGSNNIPATVTAKVSGSSQELASHTNAYYTGFGNEPGKLKVTHYVDNRNADTQAAAMDVNGNEAEVVFRVENTGDIELYRVNTFHDPASPVNSGWQQQCFIGTLDPGQVRYCKRTVSVTHGGLNKVFGRAQGSNANVSATGFVNASNPTYFNVVLP